MKYTENFGLPLYEYKDGADLVEGYNKTAQFIDDYLSEASHVTHGNGAPTATGQESEGDVYVDTGGDRPSIYVFATDDDGNPAWIEVIDSNRPSKWFTGNGDPVSGPDYLPNDMYLDVDTANVWMYVGEPSEDLTVDVNASPVRLMKNGEIIGRNWFYRQGSTHISIEGAVGRKDYEGNPSSGGATESVRLPMAAYITPFSVSGSVDAPYDLYYRLSAKGFDSGRHFEHHNAEDKEYTSEAEVAITRPSTYSTCVFTIDPGDDVSWSGEFDVTTYGLYQAYDYAKMLQNGVKWFDQSGHIEYTEPWIFICTLGAAEGQCRVPKGGTARQVLTKVSDADYDLQWEDVRAQDVTYGDSDVSEALDSLKDADGQASGRIDLIDERVSNVESRVTKTETDIAANTEGIAQNKAAIAENRADIDGHSETLAQHAEDIQTNADGVAANAAGITALTGRVDDHETRIAENTKGVADNKADVAQNAVDIAQNAAAISKNTTDIANLSTKTDSNSDRLIEHDGRISALEDRADADDTADAALEARVTTVEANVRANADDIDALDTRVTANEGSIRTLDGRLDAVEDDVTRIDGDVSRLTDRVTKNEKDIISLDGRMTNAESGIADLDSDVSALTDRVSKNETDISALDTRMDSAESSITALDGRVTANETSIETLDGRMDSAEATLTDLGNDVESLDGRVTKNETDIKGNTESLTYIDTRLDAAETTVTDLSGRVGTIETEGAKLQQDVRELHNEIANVKTGDKQYCMRATLDDYTINVAVYGTNAENVTGITVTSIIVTDGTDQIELQPIGSGEVYSGDVRSYVENDSESVAIIARFVDSAGVSRVLSQGVILPSDLTVDTATDDEFRAYFDI